MRDAHQSITPNAAWIGFEEGRKGSLETGKLGVVEEGALADLLLVDGDPIADRPLVADPEKNFLVIMKGGKVFKNTVK